MALVSRSYDHEAAARPGARIFVASRGPGPGDPSWVLDRQSSLASCAAGHQPIVPAWHAIAPMAVRVELPRCSEMKTVDADAAWGRPGWGVGDPEA
jgi:hypothetical protein